MKGKKKSARKIGKPNRFLYAIIYAVLKRKYTKKYKKINILKLIIFFIN